MNFDAGICPKCKEYLLLKSNVPFLVCPLCGQSISSTEAKTGLQHKCQDQDNINDLIADCIALEIQYGPELPFMILSELLANFPYLESPAYLLTKMTGYEVGAVRSYLRTFAGTKSDPSNVPWAEEFLDNCLDYRNMEFADLFVAYIQNKIRPDKQDKYRRKLQKLRKEYTFKASNPDSTKWLYVLYIVSAVVNVLLFPGFMLLSGVLSQFAPLHVVVNMAIATSTVCLEILLLFIHNKIYGNRLGMSDRERILMAIFMSSLIFVVGAGVMGSIWQIKL